MKKNLLKLFSLSAIVAAMSFSCSSDDKVTDGVQDSATNGAVLRTIELISTELPIGAADAAFSVQVEEQDAQDGALLESVDVFVTFADNSSNDGDTTGANFNEVSLGNIPASAFSTDTPFGLPRTTISYPLAELLSATGLTQDQLFGGDTFTFRLSLNLTDGRVFTSTNAAPIITSGFFNSPFRYTATVTCDVTEEYATGNYALTIVEGLFPAFGATIDWTEETLSVINDPDQSTGRIVENACYLPEFGSFCGPINFNLVCGSVIVPNQAPGGGVGCGAAILMESDLTDLGSYDPNDDSVIDLIFQQNIDNSGNCGGASEYRQVLRLTKIN